MSVFRDDKGFSKLENGFTSPNLSPSVGCAHLHAYCATRGGKDFPVVTQQILRKIKKRNSHKIHLSQCSSSFP